MKTTLCDITSEVSPGIGTEATALEFTMPDRPANELRGRIKVRVETEYTTPGVPVPVTRFLYVGGAESAPVADGTSLSDGNRIDIENDTEAVFGNAEQDASVIRLTTIVPDETADPITVTRQRLIVTEDDGQ